MHQVSFTSHEWMYVLINYDFRFHVMLNSLPYLLCLILYPKYGRHIGMYGVKYSYDDDKGKMGEQNISVQCSLI